MAQRKKASVRMVAEYCGVSTATVSRVLNNDRNVTDETRRLVLNAIEETGYVPTAPAVYEPKVEKIGVVIVSSESDYYNAVLGSIGKYFRNMDISVVAINTEGVPGYLPTAMETLYDCNIQGLILLSCDYLSVRDHIHSKIPHVWIDCNDSPEQTVNICQVQSDHFISGKLAAQELLRKGCRNPIMITGTSVSHRCRNRIDGFITEFEKHDIHIPEEHIIHLPGVKSHVTESKEMVRYLETKEIHFDSIFADNDGRALGAYVGVQMMGLSIPDDIRIIGFDGISAAVTNVLNISCVQQNVSLLTQNACEMLLNLIRHIPVKEKLRIIPTNVLPGQTI